MRVCPTHPFARLDTLCHPALGRPLVALLLLVAGGLLLYSVALLINHRDAAATFMPEDGIGPLGRAGVEALTLPIAPARAADAASAPAAPGFEVALAALKAVPADAGVPDPAPDQEVGRLMVDAAAPPLRIEIMGLADTVWTARKTVP